MEFFQTILTEMFLGNFSFAILIVGIIQTILMIINLYYTKKNILRGRAVVSSSPSFLTFNLLII